MNKIDIENIRKELNKREAAEYKFESGGDLSQSEILNTTTENLNKMIKNFLDDGETKASQKIKKIVDEIFKKYAEGNDNMIVLGACNYYDEDRYVSFVEEPLKEIDFDGFGHDYNKLAYPIGRDYDLRAWDEDNGGYIGGADDDKYEELMKNVQKIVALMPDLGLTDIEKYWDDNNDEINECWYGVHAITKDYKIVTFVIRDDGMLCDDNDKCFNSFHNKTLYTIK